MMAPPMKTKTRRERELLLACEAIAKSKRKSTPADAALFEELAHTVRMVEHPDRCRCPLCDGGERHQIAAKRRDEARLAERRIAERLATAPTTSADGSSWDDSPIGAPVKKDW